MAAGVAPAGPAGPERALLNHYEAVVPDRHLPGVHGDDGCAGPVAACRRSRVLMPTAAAGMEDLADEHRIGADDYLPKPFGFSRGPLPWPDPPQGPRQHATQNWPIGASP
jgi:two-component system response regulator VanR